MDSDHRQGSVLEDWEDSISHTVEVLHQVPLRCAGSVEEGLVQVRQRDALA